MEMIKRIFFIILSINMMNYLFSLEERKLFDEKMNYYYENKDNFVDNNILYECLEKIYNLINKKNIEKKEEIIDGIKNEIIYDKETNLCLVINNEINQRKDLYSFVIYRSYKIYYDNNLLSLLYLIDANLLYDYTKEPDLILYNYETKITLTEILYFSKKAYDNYIGKNKYIIINRFKEGMEKKNNEIIKREEIKY
jgi:hypothetical protein